MKSLQKTILTVALFGAASTLSHSAVLYTYAGTTINEASTSVPSMSLSRNTSSTGTLYFKYTVTNPASNSTNEDYYAGMQLYDSGAERIGIGNAWGAYAYSAFASGGGDVDLKSANPEPGEVYQLVRATDTITIVFRVDYNSGTNDNITAWLNPDLGLTEAAQNSSLVTTFMADATFNDIKLREGGGGSGWAYSNIAIAENSTDSGFFAAVPEPSSALLGAIGLLALLRRRR
jgi:hypothetical protein